MLGYARKLRHGRIRTLAGRANPTYDFGDGWRAARISSHTRGGDSGRSRGSTPSEPSAAATALAMTPPTGMMPPSPAPLAPSGLVGDGFASSATARIRGKSLAVGSR